MTLKDLILTFAEKIKEAVFNLVSSFRVVSISAEVPEEGVGILSKSKKGYPCFSLIFFGLSICKINFLNFLILLLQKF